MSTNTVKRNKKSVSSRVGNFFVHVFLAMLAAVWVLPIFWIILTSFRAEQGSYVSTFFPKGYTFANYIKLFTDRNVLNFPRDCLQIHLSLRYLHALFQHSSYYLFLIAYLVCASSYVSLI